MTDVTSLPAEPRTESGTGPARALRRAGRIPAIVYGGQDGPVSISLEGKLLERFYFQGGFFNALYDLDVDGRKVRVIPRDVQLHPVSDRPLHVDFMRVSEQSTIEVAVPVHFLNEEKSPGIKAGGMLNIVRHEVDLICSAGDIPHFIEVDLTGTQLGDSIHISAIVLPAGATPAITDRDFTVATIAPPGGGAGAAQDAAEDAAAAKEE